MAIQSDKDISIESDFGSMGYFKEENGIMNAAKSFKKYFEKNFPTEKDDHFFGHTYSYKNEGFLSLLDFYKTLFEYLDISNQTANSLQYYCYRLAQPEANRKLEEFLKNFSALEGELETSDKLLAQQLAKIQNIECLRLTEAMRCLGKNCRYACVVMAVSAVENRLHKLMSKTNKLVYNQRFKQATLGGLIALYRDPLSFKDKKFDKLKRLLPEKHKPLMEMLNTYRIFSAHPKEEMISFQTAKAILVFSFLLLIDDKLSV